MSHLLTIAELESGINRRIKARPFSDHVLPADLRQMAEVYGAMIWNRQTSIDTDALPASVQGTLIQWCAVGGAQELNAERVACQLRQRGADTGDCEACQ